MHTNINLLYNENQYNYIVEYNQSTISTNKPVQYITNDLGNYVSFQYDEDPLYIKQLNTWNKNNCISKSDYTPSEYKTAEIVLYFPTYSIDLYDKNIKYSLTINIWINGVKVIIGSYIIDRSQTYACDREKIFMNNKYYECIKFEIIDPYSLMYSDDWKDFRENVCNEPPKTNSVGSIINFALHPITYNQDEDMYVKNDKYIGGQNSINMSGDDDDFINLKLKTNVKDKLDINERPSIILDIGFNHEYEQTLNGLNEYLEETYKIKNCSIKYELIIGNENELYAVLNSDVISLDNNENNIDYVFTKDDILNTNNFTSWRGWKEGIFLTGSVNIIDNTNESIISILSNKLPLNHDIYKYFVGTDFYVNKSPINNINLDLVNMKLYNINAVNKIENTVVQISRPEDTKSRLIQPMFYKSVDITNINIHPMVVENICINLDIYKSKVDTFILKIEDSLFQEIGRTQSGVLFKIKNPTIIKDEKGKVKLNGIYYILNQDNELVTSGKYNYII